MQIRSLSLKLLTPFNSIKLFQFMSDRVLDLAIKREMQNGLHPHPPEKSFLKSWLFGFLYTVLVEKTVLVIIVFFFLLVMRAHARQMLSQK